MKFVIRNKDDDIIVDTLYDLFTKLYLLFLQEKTRLFMSARLIEYDNELYIQNYYELDEDSIVRFTNPTTNVYKLNGLKLTSEDLKTLTWEQIEYGIMEEFGFENEKYKYKDYIVDDMDYGYEYNNKKHKIVPFETLTWDQFIKAVWIYSIFGHFDWLGGDPFLSITEKRDEQDCLTEVMYDI
ncbi:MAG: hypothetical protein K0U10_06705 [Gammaproteobacteria bacterium]|nr:hypothetical protein [Gammaproteobacteria bacterium]